MARASMSSLISSLRYMTNAGSADYTIAGASHWTDNQLQDALDRRRYEVREETLTAYEALQTGGTVAWFDYQSEFTWFETTDGGTARFILQNAAGSVLGTATYSVNYERGLVTFTSDMGGSTVYLTGFAYDIYGAAADIWRAKAGHAAEMVDFSTDNHSVKRSHQTDAFLRMASKYDSMSGAPVRADGNTTIYRSDYNA